MIFPVFSAATEFDRSPVLEGSREIQTGLTLAQFGWFREFICDDTLFLFDYGFVEGTDMRMTPLGDARAIWGALRELEQATGGHLETICAYSFDK